MQLLCPLNTDLLSNIMNGAQRMGAALPESPAADYRGFQEADRGQIT